MLNNQQYFFVASIFGLLLFSAFYRHQLKTLQVFRLITLLTTIFLFYLDINTTSF